MKSAAVDILLATFEMKNSWTTDVWRQGKLKKVASMNVLRGKVPHASENKQIENDYRRFQRFTRAHKFTQAQICV